MKYILEYSYLINSSEPLRKNKTYFPTRWCHVAVSDDEEALEQYAQKYYSDVEWRITERPI